MKNLKRFLKCMKSALFLSFVLVGSAYGRAVTIRSVAQFDELIAQSPMSVVLFFDKAQGQNDVTQAMMSVSRLERYKQAELKFFIVDAHRLSLSQLFDRYGVSELPRVQVFLRAQPMRHAFMTGCLSCHELQVFIERYLDRALTAEINHKKVRRDLAQAPRPYYAADYYNRFYMMPWDNYSPPSDWPDQGPLWVGIEID